MKTKIVWGSVSLVLCVISGVAGAYAVTLLQGRKAAEKTLRVRRLELIDANRNVRAVFSVEDDGNVFLRMFSRTKVPVVELGVDEDPGPYQLYTPGAILTMRDGDSTPVVRFRTFRAGDAMLSFSSTQREDQVAVGYMPYGDVIHEEHDPAVWGIGILGPNHKSDVLGVYTEDSMPQKFLGPRKTGPSN